MVATEIQPAFSNIQLELLKLYALNIAEDDLLAIRVLLANYFAEKAADEADRIWRERNYDAETILNTHLRTPYKTKEQPQA
jgi:hypothetical protein